MRCRGRWAAPAVIQAGEDRLRAPTLPRRKRPQWLRPLSRFSVRLRVDVRDERGPVGQEGAGRGVGRRVCDVLGGNPHAVTIRDRCGVVTPARDVATELVIAGEAVLRSLAGTGNVDISDPVDGVDGGVGGAGEVIGSHQREGYDALAGSCHTDGREQEVLLTRGDVALLDGNRRERSSWSVRARDEA